MFCPNCGTQVTESLKFCKKCGANLLGVREAMTRGGGNFDWGKTWVAEMLLSEDERERKRGVTLEEKRYNEIKAGIITAVAGLGAMIFFLLFMPAVAQNEPHDAHILTRLWVTGLVPFLIGLSIIFNGVFLSRKIIETRNRQVKGAPETGDLSEPFQAAALPDNTSTLGPAFSVVESTTRPISDPVEAPGHRESN
jgi:hypothetical protein